jgi:hypothetical protein
VTRSRTVPFSARRQLGCPLLEAHSACVVHLAVDQHHAFLADVGIADREFTTAEFGNLVAAPRIAECRMIFPLMRTATFGPGQRRHRYGAVQNCDIVRASIVISVQPKMMHSAPPEASARLAQLLKPR